jgi:hypothetical protein
MCLDFCDAPSYVTSVYQCASSSFLQVLVPIVFLGIQDTEEKEESSTMKYRSMISMVCSYCTRRPETFPVDLLQV